MEQLEDRYLGFGWFDAAGQAVGLVHQAKFCASFFWTNTLKVRQRHSER